MSIPKKPDSKSKSPDLAEVELVYKSKIQPSKRTRIGGTKDAAQFLQKVWSNQIEIQEEFLVVGLDSGNKVLGWIRLTSGEIDQTIFTPRMTFQAALLMNAAGIILSHNHPSGDIEPSDHDIKATQKIVKLGQEMYVRVIDHIIIGPENQYFSMAESGLIVDEGEYDISPSGA